ncbi:MAG: 50S ribosomal protein L11 methyltransferase [Halanaerobiales bacterium]|nr:50S ribosomal protein L11 methyltransferase [Halanaerobiales bacterium]
MKWKKVEIKVQPAAEEAVANILIEAGAQGVVVEDGPEKIGLAAYYHDHENFSAIFRNIKEQLAKLSSYGLATGRFEITVNITRDEDWSTSWHQFFKPLKVGRRFLICPDWEDCQQDERKTVLINPGMAFGIGGHQTTKMCIELLEKYAGQRVVKMLDVGCGTAILSIIGAFLGVQAITAIDLDPAAVAAARENIAINGVKGIIEVRQGDLTAGLNERFPLVTANLLPELISRLLPALPGVMSEGGLVILSGIIEEKKGAMLAELAELDFTLLEEKQEEEWISLVARKG